MASQPPETVSPEIKVSIKSDDNGRVIIDSSHSLPNISSIILQFPSPKRTLIKRFGTYNTLDYIIRQTASTISFQEWSDAIASVIARQLENKRGVTTETTIDVQSSLILVGDSLYKMTPMKTIPPSKMLVEARKLILDRAKEQAEHNIATAKLTAAGIIRDASRQRDEVEKTLVAARNELARVPPLWAVQSHIPIKMYGDRWAVRFKFSQRISHFDVKYSKPGTGRESTFSWEAAKLAPRIYYAWVPLYPDGKYDITSIHLDDDGRNLPHMNGGGACMSPADNPERINSSDTLNTLAASVGRCHSRVQLDSLYVNPAYWMEDFKAAFPSDLYDAIKQHHDWSKCIALAESHNPPLYNLREENKNVWTL